MPSQFKNLDQIARITFIHTTDFESAFSKEDLQSEEFLEEQRKEFLEEGKVLTLDEVKKHYEGPLRTGWILILWVDRERIETLLDRNYIKHIQEMKHLNEQEKNALIKEVQKVLGLNGINPDPES